MNLPSINKSLTNQSFVIRKQGYHSYPDENEKPKISQNKSTVPKSFDKSKFNMALNSKIGVKLSEPIQGFSQDELASDKRIGKIIPEISKLKNGLTIASIETKELMNSFAFVIKTTRPVDSTGKPEDISGFTQFIELSAFQTNDLNTKKLNEEIVELGGMLHCAASKDCLVYFIDVSREKTAEALKLFAASILRPTYTEEEVSATHHVMQLMEYEIMSEALSRDGIFTAAYQKQSMGQPVAVFDPARISQITREKIVEFVGRHLTGDNCVFAGVGISHDELVKIGEEMFSSLPPVPPKPLLSEKTKFIGGLYMKDRQLKEPFCRLTIGFEIGGFKGKDIVTACVLQSYLGGGSSFSAGGPGKGMYTKLYEDVLCRYGWLESCHAIVHAHDESGLLCIEGSCKEEDLQALYKVCYDQFVLLAVQDISDIAFSRAKNMLRSSLFMQLESRIIQCEDLGKQIATFGHRETGEELSKKIDKVTKADIRNLVTRLLQEQQPAVAVIGPGVNESIFPSYEVLKDYNNKYKANVAQHFKIKL